MKTPNFTNKHNGVQFIMYDLTTKIAFREFYMLVLISMHLNLTT